MKLYSKITFFYILIIFSTTIISCDSDTNFNQILPYVPNTNIIISLEDPKYFDLQTPGESVLIPDYQSYKVGYKGHGIIIIKVFDNTYKAWDASSTYDFNVALKVSGAIGTCPESDIKYDLLYGVPFEKSGEQNTQIKEVPPLQEYYCSKISTNKIRISNKPY